MGFPQDRSAGDGSGPESTRLASDALKEAFGPQPNAAPAQLLAKLDRHELLLPSRSKTEDAVDLVNGFADGAIFRPSRAVQQMLGVADDDLTAAKQATSKSHRTGQVIGSFVPFVGMVGITRGASAEFFGQCYSPSVGRMLTEQATAGFLTGSLLVPSELKPEDNLFSARLKQGTLSAWTFASMTGISATLDHELPQANPDLIQHIARRVTITFLSGTVGSFVDVNGKTNFGASAQDTLTSTINYGVFGGYANSAQKPIFGDPKQHKKLDLDCLKDNNANGELPTLAEKTAIRLRNQTAETQNNQEISFGATPQEIYSQKQGTTNDTLSKGTPNTRSWADEGSTAEGSTAKNSTDESPTGKSSRDENSTDESSRDESSTGKSLSEVNSATE